MRSVLIVPVEGAEQLDAAFASGADALILDLGALSTDLAVRSSTRHLARDFLRAAQLDAHRPHLYIRLEGLDGNTIDADLSALMIAEPDGIMLGDCRSGIDLQHLGAKLAVHEAEYGLTDGETGIIAEAATTARSVFGLGSYSETSARLVAIAWDAERLAADVGGDHAVGSSLDDFAPFHTVRHLTLFAARAAEVAAIDAASSGLADQIFLAECEAARRQGFNAKIAAAPSQITIINAVFDREVEKPFG